jgi:hypothetical protein
MDLSSIESIQYGNRGGGHHARQRLDLNATKLSQASQVCVTPGAKEAAMRGSTWG